MSCTQDAEAFAQLGMPRNQALAQREVCVPNILKMQCMVYMKLMPVPVPVPVLVLALILVLVLVTLMVRLVCSMIAPFGIAAVIAVDEFDIRFLAAEPPPERHQRVW